jgi:TyrR family helix-turn-helix protein
MVIKLSQYDSTILITGESGTGKELIAEFIHNNSSRENGPFIKVNCGAIPENLLESELFGYDYGAFTGAKKGGKTGYFQMANGGTIFLDEIGDLPYNLQVKLLRVLQNKEIIRVGGEQAFSVDVHIIAGTNRNLLELVQSKKFREDLYYRLSVIPVHIPPLRERKEDIPALVNHFTNLFNKKHQQQKRISPEVIEYFMAADWPGNVRELENMVERLLVTSSNNIVTREDLPENLVKANSNNQQIAVYGIMPLSEARTILEKQLLENAFAQYPSTRQIARVLKVSAATIVRKAARYGIKK